MVRLLAFPGSDPVRDLRDYCAARFDRLDYILGALAEAPAAVPEQGATNPAEGLARVLAYRRP